MATISAVPAYEGFPMRLVVVLCAATAIGPLAMQIVMPALPIIQGHYAISTGVTQLVFSVSAFSIALATLLYGPLSDRYGRRPAIIAGLTIYIIGSVVCILAPSIEWLIFGRVVQAVGGCAGMVLSRAIVRDLFDRERAAQMIAYITMGMVIAPMFAPVIGGALIDAFDWRAIFVFGALIGIAIFVFVYRDLNETAPPGTSDVTGPAAMLRAFGTLLTSRAYLAYCLQGSFSMSVFFAFLAGAPYLVIQTYGQTPSTYGLYFILISASFILGNFTAARLSARFGSDRMIMVGSGGALLGASIALGFALSGSWTSIALFGPMCLTAFFQGMSMPNGQAAVVSVFPQMAGSASGLAGFVQMGTAASVAQLVGMLQNGTPFPIVVAMSLCALAALISIIMAVRSR
ncbi:MAG: multidrug effflux MFS transporter [Pseudomonadota bacterium]